MSPRYTPVRPIVHHHIVLKPHHRWIIGSFTSVVIIFMIVMSVFMYTSFVKQEVTYKALDKKISDLRTEMGSNINTLSESIIETKADISAVGSQIGTINQEFAQLKASAGADFSGIIEDVVSGVVTVRTDVSQGTGFIITSEGYIVTNYHVVEGAKAATIITSDNQNHQVSLIGYDGNLDIALLKIDGNYNALSLADSDSVSVGEKVIAIGNPLGLQFSVSQGIVSAIHREGPNGINAYIQTDAALNPGNSGGPLINSKGEVVGINNFKTGNSESLGFALESNYIKDAVNGIYQEGYQSNLI